MSVHEPAAGKDGQSPTNEATNVGRSGRMRAVAAVGGLALVAGTAVFSTAFADTAPASCFTYTDPTGDAIYDPTGAVGDPSGMVYDPDLDLIGITHSVQAAAFLSQVKVVKLAATGPANEFGDRFKVTFTINKHVFTILAQRDFDPTGQGLPVGDTWTNVTVDSTSNPMTVTVKYDLAANTVTMSVPVADMEKAAGMPLLGATIGAMSAESRGTFNSTQIPANPLISGGFPSLVYDKASDGTKTAVIAEGCGGAPAPGTSGTPVPTGTPGPSGTPAPTDSPTAAPSGGVFSGYAVPRKKCFDTAGSSAPDNANLLGVVPYPGSDPDTKLTGMVGRTTGGLFKAFLGDPGLSTDGTGLVQDGDIFTYGFTVGGKAVVISATRSAGKAQPPTTTVAGKDVTADLKPTATYDTKNGFVVLAIDQAGLAKATGATIVLGTVFTATKATSTWVDITGAATPSDTVQAAKPADQIYSVGVDACFFPPAGTFDVQPLGNTQYGHGVDTGVTLSDADGAAVPHQTVTFGLGSAVVSAVTDQDGFATVLVPARVKAGAYNMTISFAGNADVGPTSVHVPVRIVAAKTKIGLASVRNGSTRTVRAALQDDARHGLAGQSVQFSYGSKRVTLKTDNQGIAQLRGVPAGATVTVSYPGSAGYYTASKGSIRA